MPPTLVMLAKRNQAIRSAFEAEFGIGKVQVGSRPDDARGLNSRIEITVDSQTYDAAASERRSTAILRRLG